jgi:putative aldouronate transport system permease protein
MVGEHGLGDRIVNALLSILVGFAALLCLLPFVHVVAVSLSSRAAVSTYSVDLWPIGFNLDNYLWVVRNEQFAKSLAISVVRVATGVSTILLLGVVTAYPLSREDIHMPGRTVFKLLLLFGMLFSGGLIPFFLSMKSLGLLNNLLVLILPGALNIFYVMLLLNFFRGLPHELTDAAAIDGASHLDILFRIYLPISRPVLATVTLFAAIQHWNSWFDGVLFLKRSQIWPLQSYLYSLISIKTIEWTGPQARRSAQEFLNATPEGLTTAFIVFASVPIILVYPLLQRYFVTGLTLGAVKE